jgi:regulator of replication initiation timing
MEISQNKLNNTYFVDQESFFKSAIMMKMDSLEEQILDLNNEINNMKDLVFLEKGEKNKRFSLENKRKKENNIISCVPNDWKEAQKIVARAIEILSEWGETEDMRMQVQYAALVVGKIDNLKKIEIIRFDEVRNKVCTLLKNVIRLNIADKMFSREQVQLLKDGFLLISEEKLQKEDLLQLNRKLRTEGLQTMPAWE